MCVHGKQCVTWVQAMSACVCDTSVCSCIKSKKKPTTSEWRHTSKQQTEVWHKFYKNWAFCFPKSEHLSSFHAFVCTAREQTTPAKRQNTNNNNNNNNHTTKQWTKKTSQHLSVFQPTNKMASGRRLKANNMSVSNRNDPAVFCEKLQGKIFKRKYPPTLKDGGSVCLVQNEDVLEYDTCSTIK